MTKTALELAWGPTLLEQQGRVALNKYNVPEILSLLIKAMEVADLGDTVDKLKHMGITRMINDAWMNRNEGEHL